MSVCYKCGMQNPEKSYRCIYNSDGARVTVLLCAKCSATYPFTNVIKDILNRDLPLLIKRLPVIESMQPIVDVARAEEEAERYALWAAAILITIVLTVAAITIWSEI